MYLSPHPNAVDPDALTEALASGELMTANQAAQLIDVPFTTFNYHVRLGHIAVIPYAASRMTLVTRASAERFQRKLQRFRNQNEHYEWLTDDDEQDDQADEQDTADTQSAPGAERASA